MICDECGKELATAKGLAGHKRLAHARSSEAVSVSKGGEAMEEKDVKAMIKAALAEEKQEEARTKREESEKSHITEAIKGIDHRLDKLDASVSDICSRFPDLCTKVDKLEEAMPRRVEANTDEWKAGRKADLEHILFSECPECGPVRDELLSSKGKKLADVEPESKEEKEKVEEAKVEDKVEEPETSPYPRDGFKFDYDKRIYVKQEA